MIDTHLIPCFFIDSVRVTASLFYTFFVISFETYIVVDWFYLPIVFMSFPYILAITACWYTRSAFYNGRRNRLTKNYCICCQLAYRSLGGVGIIRYGKPHCFQGEISGQNKHSLQTKRFAPTSHQIDCLLQELDVLTHHQFLQSCTTRTILLTFKALTSTDTQYKRILLEAQGLRMSL